ncbi:hypothetical protein B0H21DRAFT_865057 [Amylocystis lapponica]|nr:hypothetical protein B0H21DRAFT_865057 [Amylocystis lapponica]
MSQTEDSQSPLIVRPEPSYFSPKSRKVFSIGGSRGTPANSRPGTPGPDEQSRLLSPNPSGDAASRNFLKMASRSKSPAPSKSPVLGKRDNAVLSKLQSRFTSKNLSLEGSAPNLSLSDLPKFDIQSPDNVTFTDPWRSGAHGDVPLIRRAASTSDISAPMPLEQSRSSPPKASSPSYAADTNSGSKSSSATEEDGSPLSTVSDQADTSSDSQDEPEDEEALRLPVAKDYATKTQSHRLLGSQTSRRHDPSSRHITVTCEGNNRWTQRLRARGSSGDIPRRGSSSTIQSTLSSDEDASSSPSFSMDIDASAGRRASEDSTAASEATSEMTLFDSNWSFPRRGSGKSLDVDIDFDRIKSPVPIRVNDAPPERITHSRRPSAIGRLGVDTAIVEDIEPESEVDGGEDNAVVKTRKRYASLPHADIDEDGSEFGSDVDYDEDDSDVEFEPEVPPAFEYVDPEISCVVPNASTVTLPQVEDQLLDQPAFQHPWVTPPFNVTEREKRHINKYTASFKIITSLSVVGSLLVGYGLKVKIVTFGKFSFGMYGLLLVIDFVIQTIAASFNRRRVNKLTAESPLVKAVGERLASKDTVPATDIAVVGYREDEEAWTSCLKSLQAQEYPIKHIIGVVDGNDGPDLDMATAFGKAFDEGQATIVHLPVLLSVMYKEKYWQTINAMDHPPLTRWQYFKMWLTQDPRPGQQEAHEVAWNHILNYIHTKPPRRSGLIGEEFAFSNMMALLFSDKRIAGVTGDVRIWNKSDSFLALMSSIRYWFAFNVERACQSAFGCVGCLSGPLGLYRTADLMSVLGPWILQQFLGKETTFGDDRHLSNRILSLGHRTGYTHLAMCDSDTPAGYVRWVKQQTRWSKSFFREAYWFPKSFAYHDFWLTVETTKQFLYPMVLTATVLHMLYSPGEWIRPVIWLGTMFGVAVIKSTYGVICLRDPRQFLFGIYGFMYFFGLLPSKLFACFTVHVTNWGTSARSKSEFARPESFISRTTHVGHLVTWYLALSIGLGYFLATVFSQPLFWFIGLIGIAPTAHAYSDVIVGETKYYMYVLRKKLKERRGAQKLVDVEMAPKKKRTVGRALKKLRRRRVAVEATPGVPQEVTVDFTPPPAVHDVASVVFSAPSSPRPSLNIDPRGARPSVVSETFTLVGESPPTHPSYKKSIITTVDPATDPFADAASEKPLLVVRKPVPQYIGNLSAYRKASVASYDSTLTASSSYDLPAPMPYLHGSQVPFTRTDDRKMKDVSDDLEKGLVRIQALSQTPLVSG